MKKLSDYLFYQDDWATIYCGDCLEIMPLMEPESVDLVVTDPPYNVSNNGAKIVRGEGTRFDGGDINLDFGDWDKNSIIWENYLFLIPKILTMNGVYISFSEKIVIGFMTKWLKENGHTIRHIGAMIKSNPAPQARRVKWQNGVELFFVSTRNNGEGHHFQYQLGQSPDWFMTNNCYEHLHPTQKPMECINWMISYWSFKNDLVFDPFLGSGTTCVAAKNLNRKSIGIEINPKYCEIAVKRLRQEVFDFRKETTNDTIRRNSKSSDGRDKVNL